MGIQQWSERIWVVDLADDPMMADDLDALGDSLTTQGPRDVLLDFSAVTFVNSTSIARLLRLRKRQADSGRRLKLCALTDNIWSVFLVTGLDAIFEFSPQRSIALAQLQMG